MRSWCALVRLLVVAALLGLPPSAALSQEATPAADGQLVHLALAELAPGNASVVGVTRTTFEPGGSLRLVAGAGPTLLVVETGSLVVQSAAPPEPLLVAAGNAAASPDPLAAGEDHPLETGSALVIPAGGIADLRNDGTATAATLDLLAATDAALEAETGVGHVLLARRESTLPGPPVEVSFGRATIGGGDRLETAPAPVLTVAVTVDYGHLFLLTGQNFNRGADPLPVYVLSIAPANAETGTPAP